MNRILFVDDDINILNGFKRLFRNKYTLFISNSGNEALKIIASSEPFEVVVSDYRMPEMDGIKFLSSVKSISPNTVRIMLTGFADVNAAIDSINEGNIFRFLTKPIANEQLERAIKDGIDYYHLLISEKELLQQTLRGVIKLLVEILELTNPLAFSKSVRLRDIVKKLSKNYSDALTLKIELAALLSQIGIITLPQELLEKLEKETILSPTENKLYLNHPNIAKSLLTNIPRFEEIADAISQQFIKGVKLLDNSDDANDEVVIIAKILRKAIELDSFLERKRKEEEIELKLHSEKKAKEKDFGHDFLRVGELKPGMKMGLDVVDRDGVVLLGAGQELTQISILRLRGFLELGRIDNLFKVLLI